MPYAHLTEQIGDKNQHYYSWVQCRGAQWQFGNGEGGRGDLGADCRHISELARMGEGLTANHHPYRHHHHHQNWDIGLLLLYSGGGLYLPGAKSSRLTFNSESWKRPGKVWSTMVLSHQWRERERWQLRKDDESIEHHTALLSTITKPWWDWSGRSLVSAFYSWMIFPDWAFFCPAGSHFRRGGGDGGNPLRAAARGCILGEPTSNPHHPFPPHPSPSIHSAPSPLEGNFKKVQKYKMLQYFWLFALAVLSSSHLVQCTYNSAQ